MITYGNPTTKEVWESATPEVGYVGNSVGPQKIPILIRTSRSIGGEGILSHCILKIVTSKGKQLLYKA